MSCINMAKMQEIMHPQVIYTYIMWALDRNTQGVELDKNVTNVSYLNLKGILHFCNNKSGVSKNDYFLKNQIIKL